MVLGPLITDHTPVPIDGVLALKVMPDVVTHIPCDAPALARVGREATVIVALFVAVKPLPSVMLTVYSVVTIGLTVGVGLPEEKPAGDEDHEYVIAGSPEIVGVKI